MKIYLAKSEASTEVIAVNGDKFKICNTVPTGKLDGEVSIYASYNPDPSYKVETFYKVDAIIETTKKNILDAMKSNYATVADVETIIENTKKNILDLLTSDDAIEDMDGVKTVVENLKKYISTVWIPDGVTYDDIYSDEYDCPEDTYYEMIEIIEF